MLDDSMQAPCHRGEVALECFAPYTQQKSYVRIHCQTSLPPLAFIGTKRRVLDAVPKARHLGGCALLLLLELVRQRWIPRKPTSHPELQCSVAASAVG